MGDFGFAARIDNHAQKKKNYLWDAELYRTLDLGGPGHTFEVDLQSFGAICYTLTYG